MVIQNPNVIFIHQSKTAGTSLTKWLKNTGEMLYHNDIINHHNLQAVVNHGVDIDDYTVFTVLRHPRDRIFSYYNMCYHPAGFNYPRDWGNLFDRHGYVSIEQFVERVHPGLRFLEDLFWYMSVDGGLYQHSHYLRFESLYQQLSQLLSCEVELPHSRRRNPNLDVLDPRTESWYCDAVDLMYEHEIAHFFS